MLAIDRTNIGCHVKQLYNFYYGKKGTRRREINQRIGKFEGVVLASVVTKTDDGDIDWSQYGSYKNLLACGFKRAGKAFKNPSTDNKVILLYKITAK